MENPMVDLNGSLIQGENYNTLYAYAIDVDGPAYKAPMSHGQKLLFAP